MNEEEFLKEVDKLKTRIVTFKETIREVQSARVQDGVLATGHSPTKIKTESLNDLNESLFSAEVALDNLLKSPK